MDPIEEKLAALGLVLPPPPSPGGNYVPARINGNTLVLAGVISIRDGVLTHAGQVGHGLSVAEGQAAAQVCAFEHAGGHQGALGRLDRVREFIYVAGYVNAGPALRKARRSSTGRATCS